MNADNTNYCSVCQCEFTDAEGGIHGYFGMIPVSFCPTCFSCMCDMVNQVVYFEENINE
jgi:hypothetical protein